MELYISILFLIIYYKFGTYWASGFLLISSLFLLAFQRKTLSIYQKYSLFLGIIVSILILIFDDITFYQHKITLVLVIMAFIVRYYYDVLPNLLNSFKLKSVDLKLFRIRMFRSLWMLAILNELIIKVYPFHFWVIFKFSVPILLIVLFFINYNILLKKNKN